MGCLSSIPSCGYALLNFRDSADDLDELEEQLAELTTRLADSQRREKVATEDARGCALDLTPMGRAEMRGALLTLAHEQLTVREVQKVIGCTHNAINNVRMRKFAKWSLLAMKRVSSGRHKAEDMLAAMEKVDEYANDAMDMENEFADEMSSLTSVSEDSIEQLLARTGFQLPVSIPTPVEPPRTSTVTTPIRATQPHKKQVAILQ